jgi:antirestriction protein
MIRIALTNLRHYNEGKLTYEWVDLPQEDFSPIFDRIGHDEFFISDYECKIPNVIIHEYDDLDQLNEIAETLEKLTYYGKMNLIAILESEDSRLDEALETLSNERFIFYPDVDLVQLAQQLVDEGIFGEVPTSLVNYIDYEQIAKDLECDGYVETSVGVIVYD